MRRSRAARWAGEVRLKSGKARRAAVTARSMSAALPSATVATTSFVAGFTTSAVRVPCGSTHAPSM